MKNGILPLVIGNWKMNPQSVTLAAKLATELTKTLHGVGDVDVVVAPPSPFLAAIVGVKNSTKTFALGAQDAHQAKIGPHTGAVSLPMLESFGVTHVILGHSERRAEGESDTVVNEKVRATLAAGLTAVVCVGEVKRDHVGHYLSYVENQVRRALTKVSRAKLERVVIAYEPIWAIGTGVNATPEDTHEMKLFIEKALSDLYGRNYAQKVRILYGGSVDRKNARELLAEGAVDGFLVGGASLHADEFRDIVKTVAHARV
jgi:triosephosphate isomerase (TIM)